MEELTREEFWKIYKLLPKELKEAIFSPKTADAIASALDSANIEDSRADLVAKLTGRVLLGLLPPQDFTQALEKEANLSPEEARKVGLKISRLVFLPVRDKLDLIYSEELTPGSKEKALKEPQKPKYYDPYREPIE